MPSSLLIKGFSGSTAADGYGTHESKTDKDAYLFKKSKGSESKLAYLGHILMAIRSVRNVTARVTDTGRNHAVMATDQVLHSLEAATCEHSAFVFHRLSSAWSR